MGRLDLLEVMETATLAYPDEFLSEYYNEEGLPNHVAGLPLGAGGDTLAEFIVNELYEKWNETDDETPDHERVELCAEAIRTAQDELDKVAEALEDFAKRLRSK